jgi:hypothetical protein
MLIVEDNPTMQKDLIVTDIGLSRVDSIAV